MFTKEARRIFRLVLRGTERRYDPLRVRRILLRQTGGELFDVWQKADLVAAGLRRGEPVQPEALEAEEALLLAGRAAFGLEADGAEDEGGYTDAEVQYALDEWSRWLGKPDAVEGPGPTSAAPTDSGPAGDSPTVTTAPST